MRCIACNSKLEIRRGGKEFELCYKCLRVSQAAARNTFISQHEYTQAGALDVLTALECGLQPVLPTRNTEDWDDLLGDGYHRSESAPIASYFDKYED